MAKTTKLVIIYSVCIYRRLQVNTTRRLLHISGRDIDDEDDEDDDEVLFLNENYVTN